MKDRPVVHAKRIEKVAKELAVAALTEHDPDTRRLARRCARALLDIARFVRWRRWASAQRRLARLAEFGIFVPSSAKRFIASKE
jgi:hypothetical protein